MLDFRTFSNISMQLNPDLCIDLLINKIEYNKKKQKTPALTICQLSTFSRP